VFVGDDLRWSDTGETVTRDEVTYDPACFTAPAENDFMVRPRFADLIADRGALAVSSTIVGNAGGVAMLDVAVINDGNEEGSMSGLVVEVGTRSNGGIDINFRPSDPLRPADRRPAHSQLRDGARHGRVLRRRARVPGRGTTRFIVRCDLSSRRARAGDGAGWYEIEWGALQPFRSQ
jgi:hypothetical protein